MPCQMVAQPWLCLIEVMSKGHIDNYVPILWFHWLLHCSAPLLVHLKGSLIACGNSLNAKCSASCLVLPEVFVDLRRSHPLNERLALEQACVYPDNRTLEGTGLEYAVAPVRNLVASGLPPFPLLLILPHAAPPDINPGGHRCGRVWLWKIECQEAPRLRSYLLPSPPGAAAVRLPYIDLENNT
jgi:hypothetical protein